MVDNKYNLYELQKEIPYETVAPILTAWDEQSDGDVTDLARMAYAAGRNSISKEKNKMEQVAKLFGKELGEEFTVKDKYKTVWHCKFTKRGLLYLDKTFFDWQESGDYLLQFLLIGKAVILND